ncbi:hypothetical protein PT974_09336 [Cladobotryum mycophilum]|uniref:Uncharacterized protein n=1 Tax=Cladobotryum mycophilum TaxID=491253 RepID=A0ABR0SG04_9HYPO
MEKLRKPEKPKNAARVESLASTESKSKEKATQAAGNDAGSDGLRQAKRKSKNKKKNKPKKNHQATTSDAISKEGETVDTSPTKLIHPVSVLAKSGKLTELTDSRTASPQASGSGVYTPDSWSPVKRPVEDVASRAPSVTAKRNKHEKELEIEEEVKKLGEEQPMPSSRNQYQYDTLPRDRRDYRSNTGGGTLRIPKKRRTRALGVNTFEAPKSVGRAPPSSEFDFEVPAPPSMSKVEKPEEKETPATKSRLNPMAQSFSSPTKRVASPRNPSPHQESLPGSRTRTPSSASTATLQDTSPGVEDVPASPGEEEPKKKMSLSKETTEKQPVPRTKTPEDEPNQQLDPSSSKRSSRNSSGKGRHKRGETSKDVSATPTSTPKKEAWKKKVPLNMDDWPSLPMPRGRANTLPPTASKWGQGSPTK